MNLSPLLKLRFILSRSLYKLKQLFYWGITLSPPYKNLVFEIKNA